MGRVHNPNYNICIHSKNLEYIVKNFEIIS